MEVPIRSNTLEQLKYQLRCKNLQELFRKTSLPFFVVIVLTVCWSSDKECDHLLTLINKETGLVIGDVKNLPMFYCNTCGNICQHVSAWFFFTFLFLLTIFINFFHSLYSFLAQRHLCFQEILLFSYFSCMFLNPNNFFQFEF